MSDETSRQRRARELSEQVIANDAVDDFAQDAARDLKAADREIDRLRTEVDRLRASLAEIAEYDTDWTINPYANVTRLQAMAERALSPTQASRSTGMPGPCSICGGAREVLRDGGPYCSECHQSGDPAPSPATCGTCGGSKGKWLAFGISDNQRWEPCPDCAPRTPVKDCP